MYWISGKKCFFKISTAFRFDNDLSLIFGFLTPKINYSTNFHKNSLNKTQNMNENGHQEDEREGLLSKLLIAISQKLFEIEPWNLVLLLIFTVCTYAPNFIEIWKGGFQACPTLIWNFPVKIMQTCYLEYFGNAWSYSSIMIVLPWRKLWWPKCWSQLVGDFNTYFHAKNQLRP